MAAVPVHAQETVQQRWESRDRGDVLFLPSRYGFENRQKLCVLHLPHRDVEFVTMPDSVAPYARGTTPVWGRDSTDLFFEVRQPHSLRGICRLDRTTGGLRGVLPAQMLRHIGAADTMVWVPRDSLMWAYEPPSISIAASESFYHRKTDNLYALVRFIITPGPPDWSFNPDSTGLKGYFAQRARSKFGEGIHKWVDLVAVDSSGGISLVVQEEWESHRGLSVSPDGRLSAYSNLAVIRLFDRETGETTAPIVPDGVRVHSPSFSPDGTLLAALGLRQEEPDILISRAPDFVEFEPLFRSDRWQPLDMCWSADGQWILVLVTPTGAAWPQNLLAVEVETGEYAKIEHPFLLNGRPDARLVFDQWFDWID